MLQHADRDDTVEMAIELTIVLVFETHRLLETLPRRSLVSHIQLLPTECYAGDIGAHGLG